MQPAGHPYLLEEPEKLGGPFTFSVLVHVAIVSLFFTAVIFKQPSLQLGAQTQGMGVTVTAVKTIPIPRKSGQVNPLANDTESVVPQEPVKLKDQRKPEPKPVEKAIELPTEKPPKPQPKPTIQYRPREQYEKNQVFSRTPEALKSNQVGISGGGGVGIGPNSVFGYQFGAYAQQIRDLIAQKWNQAGVTSGPGAQAVVSIIIAKDGSVRITGGQTSGSYTLDNSSKRAVLDASPLPPLPAGFPRDAANVDLVFQLQR